MKNFIRVTLLTSVFGIILLPGGVRSNAVQKSSGRDVEVSQTAAAGTAIVRRAPQINGRVEGNLQQLTGEDVTLNGGAAITGDLLVPGTPTLQRNGNAQVTVVDGTGNANPTSYRVTVNGNAQLGRLVRRTDPVTLPTVAAPPQPTGTRDVTLNNANEPIGDFATLRNLTLNGNAGTRTIPPGTYGSFTVNGNAGLVLGTAGATTPGTYNLQNLTVNGGAQIQVAGPILLTLANGFTVNATMGNETNPTWLDVRVATGGVTVNGGSTLYASITAPGANGIVTTNGRIIGDLRCDRLIINGNGQLTIIQRNRLSINLVEPLERATINNRQVLVSGTFSGQGKIQIKINGIEAQFIGNKFGTIASLFNDGENQIKIEASDETGNRAEIVRTVIRSGIPPLRVEIISPDQNSITKLNKIKIYGQIIPGNGVISGLQLTMNGSRLSIDPEDGTFEVLVSLSEGINNFRFIAENASGIRQEQIHSINRDSQPPIIRIISPAQEAIVDSPTITIRGEVQEAGSVKVRASGKEVIYETRSGASTPFRLENVPVRQGRNQVTFEAIDEAGNISYFSFVYIGADKTPPPPPSLFSAASSTRLGFQPIGGRGEPNSIITISGGRELVRTIAASETGLFFVNVNLLPGINRLSALSTDSSGNISQPVNFDIISNPNLPIPPPNQPYQISISSGSGQRGLVNLELPRPLVVVVTDQLGEPVPGIQVQFRVGYGNGQIIGGTNSFIAITNPQGRAAVRVRLGGTIGSHIFIADFVGNTTSPIFFFTESIASQANGLTTVTGKVVDQNLRSLPNVIVRLRGQETRTQQDGRFLLTNIGSGPNQVLELIGRNQIRFPGRWPNISYNIDVLPGIENRLNRLLFLPKVNEGELLPLDNNNIVTRDTTYELPVVGGEPAIRITARAGTRVTFPPDAVDKRFSVTRIRPDRIPMALEDGRSTNLYISVQPSGATFNPPLGVSFPNLDKLPANNRVFLMSFDHGAGRFVQIGTGRVSGDGKTVNSDPGSGIITGAWHGFPPPAPPPMTPLSGGPPTPCPPQQGSGSCFDCDISYGPFPATPLGGGIFAATVPSVPSPGELIGYCREQILVDINASLVEKDDPSNNNSTGDLVSGIRISNIFGGSTFFTSDLLSLSAVVRSTETPISYSWSVSGSGSDGYVPPPVSVNSSVWANQIKPNLGSLSFKVTVQFADGRTATGEREFNVGIRTDDSIVVGWIDRNGVNLPLLNPEDEANIARIFPRNGRVIQTLDCLSTILFIARANECKTGGLSDRYLLEWLFKYTSNPDPSRVLQDGNFQKGNPFTDSEKFTNYIAERTNFKLFNRLQVKYYRPKDPNPFSEFEVFFINYSAPIVGITKNPCKGGTLVGAVSGLVDFPGQVGPASQKNQEPTYVSSINDGSPDSNGIRVFNAVAGCSVFWEDIGSKIRFNLDGSTKPIITVQPYPTYYEYLNGALVKTTPQACPFGNGSLTRFCR